MPRVHARDALVVLEGRGDRLDLDQVRRMAACLQRMELSADDPAEAPE